MSLPDIIYRKLGHYVESFDDCVPPGDHLSVRLGPVDRHRDGSVRPIYVVQTSNDGFELWIGTDDRWYWSCRVEDAHRLAWFVLWTWWAKGTGFGLRRRLWYWALARKVDRYRRVVGS